MKTTIGQKEEKTFHFMSVRNGLPKEWAGGFKNEEAAMRWWNGSGRCHVERGTDYGLYNGKRLVNMVRIVANR